MTELPSSGSYEIRRSAVFGALSDSNVGARAVDNALRGAWLDELRDNFDLTVERYQRRGNRNALVLQFSDANIDGDSVFINAYFQRFGAHVLTPEDHPLNITANSISTIATSSGLQSAQLKDFVGRATDQIPEGSVLITDSRGDKVLIVETNIDGVRIVMDGSAINSPQNWIRHVRPMLLVNITDAPRLNLRLPEDEKAEQEAKKKTWREIHGREPGKTSGITKHEREQWYPGLIQGSAEDATIAEVGLTWGMEAKSADEIIVTLTKLKQDALLKTEAERLDTLKQAVDMAVENVRFGERDTGRRVSGAPTYGLVIVIEVLGMSAEEIAKDGEALSDLVNYLEQAGRSGTGQDRENDPFTRTANKIKETWELPEGGLSPLMYQRVNWNRRTSDPRSN